MNEERKGMRNNEEGVGRRKPFKISEIGEG